MPPTWHWRLIHCSSCGLNHVGWDGLRTILRAQPHLTVVADVPEMSHGVTIASEARPDLILVTTEPNDINLVLLIEERRKYTPRSRIVAVGKPLSRETYAGLINAWLDGYLAWESLSSSSVPHIMASIMGSDTVIAKWCIR
jgi:DNA-binding NarL/FixJ family response regulator